MPPVGWKRATPTTTGWWVPPAGRGSWGSEGSRTRASRSVRARTKFMNMGLPWNSVYSSVVPMGVPATLRQTGWGGRGGGEHDGGTSILNSPNIHSHARTHAHTHTQAHIQVHTHRRNANAGLASGCRAGLASRSEYRGMGAQRRARAHTRAHTRADEPAQRTHTGPSTPRSCGC
jgi:hypothetical protein